jgi:hypothetical protein
MYAYRPYRAEDAGRCLSVFRGNTPDFFLPAEEPEFSRFLEALPGPFRVLEAPGGAVVACGGVAWRGDGAVLCWGMVERARHRSGLGRALLRARLLLAFETYGPCLVRLSTSQKSRDFFARHGFVPDLVLPDHFGPGLDRHDLHVDLTRGAADALRKALKADAPWMPPER